MGFLDDAIREHLELKRRRGADPADVERAEREALGPARRQPEQFEGDTYTDEALGRPEAAYEPEPTRFETEQSAVAEDPPADYLDPANGRHFSDEHTIAGPEHAAPEHVPTEHLSPDTGPIERYYRPPVEHDFSEPVVPPEPANDDPYEPEPEVGHPPAPADARSDEPEDEHGVEPDPLATPWPHAAPAGPPTEEHPPPHLSQPTQEYEVRFDEDDSEEHKGEHHDEDVLEETPEFLQDTPDHDRLWFEQRPPKDFDFNG